MPLAVPSHEVRLMSFDLSAFSAWLWLHVFRAKKKGFRLVLITHHFLSVPKGIQRCILSWAGGGVLDHSRVAYIWARIGIFWGHWTAHGVSKLFPFVIFSFPVTVRLVKPSPVSFLSVATCCGSGHDVYEFTSDSSYLFTTRESCVFHCVMSAGRQKLASGGCPFYARAAHSCLGYLFLYALDERSRQVR